MATNNPATKGRDNKNRPSNYVILTLQAIAEGEMKYSQSGKPWAVVRAFLSQGKDKQTGEYKPSIFFDVKAFSKDDEPSQVVSAIQALVNKERFTVKGRLAMREWKRQVMEIFANNIEEFHFENEEVAPADELVDELENEPA